MLLRLTLVASLHVAAALQVHGAAVAPPRTLPLVAARRVLPVVACDASTAAAEPQIISFSERALHQLNTMRDSTDGELIVRMGVRAGGCSGMSYVMDLAKPEDVAEDDTVVNLDSSMRCVIDPKSLMFLFGMECDYSDEVTPCTLACLLHDFLRPHFFTLPAQLIGGGFSFNNPNAESSCGCGKSFGI